MISNYAGKKRSMDQRGRDLFMTRSLMKQSVTRDHGEILRMAKISQRRGKICDEYRILRVRFRRNDRILKRSWRFLLAAVFLDICYCLWISRRNKNQPSMIGLSRLTARKEHPDEMSLSYPARDSRPQREKPQTPAAAATTAKEPVTFQKKCRTRDSP